MPNRHVDLEKARELLERAAQLKSVAQAALKAMKESRLRLLVEPHAELIWKRAKTLVVHAEAYELAGEVMYFGDKKYVYGKLALSAGKPMSLPEFRRRIDEHKISEAERKSWWPKARRLYAYKIEIVEPLDEPKPWRHPQETQTFVREPRFKRDPKPEEVAGWGEEDKTHVAVVLGHVLAFKEVIGEASAQAIRLMQPEGAVLQLLQGLPSLAEALEEDYRKLAGLVQVEEQPAEEAGGVFVLAERLLAALQHARTFLSPKTRILALTEDAVVQLEGFLHLEGSLEEDRKLAADLPEGPADGLFTLDDDGFHQPVAEEDCFLEKGEKPRGKLPVLKMPDPAFNIKMLGDEHETGVLSRLRRTSRTGQRQFLVNEIGPTKADAQYVWAVVVLGEPLTYKDLAEMPDDRREGIDRFSREEYATESPLYYMPMKLVAAYDPPLKLHKPIASRRYGPVISLPEALAKAAPRLGLGPGGKCVCPECGAEVEHETGAHCNEMKCPKCGAALVRKEEGGPVTTGDVPLSGPAQSGPWTSLRGLTPDALREMSDKEVRDLYDLATGLLRTVFTGGRTTADGLTREDVENALAFIKEEMKRRSMKADAVIKAGPSTRYAPIRSGTGEDGEFDELLLDDLLPHFHDEFLLRSPFVYLVGSMANNGRTKNDVDILLRGPLDEATAHIVKFRLGRMLPPDIAQRMSFHGGIPDDEVMSGIAGPFTAFTPLYDLVVRRRDDYRVVVEMREAGLPVDSLDELIAKQDPYLKLPSSEKRHPSVLQIHVRGRTAHLDFRVGAGEYLIGYTLAAQKAGSIPKLEGEGGLAEVKRLAGQFDITGSAWNKPVVAPSRLYASTKAPEPEEWRTIAAEAFKPGTVGATRNEWGYIVRVAQPQVSYGERTPVFHEYFLEKDKRFQGLLTFRLLVGQKEPTEEEAEAGRRSPKGTAFWTAMLAKSLLPSVLKRRAVNVGRIPPQGWAFLPPRLKEAVPREYQYWHAKDKKERLEIRNALVDEHFFTENNVKIVDGEFRRVVTKYYLYKATPSCTPWDKFVEESELELGEEWRFRSFCKSAQRSLETGLPESFAEFCKAEAPAGKAEFALSWQRWKGQVVIRAAPSRQLFHLFIKRPGFVEDFQILSDPTKEERISGVVRVEHKGEEAGKLLSFEGDAPPGKEVHGVKLNATKDTPSTVQILLKGTVEFVSDDRLFKKFRLRAKGLPTSLKGLLVLRAEEGTENIWFLEPSEGPGAEIDRSKAETSTAAEPAAGQAAGEGPLSILPNPPPAVQSSSSEVAGQEKRDRTGPAGRSHRHWHFVKVDAFGNGKTVGVSGKADHHVHEIQAWKVLPARGHTHDRSGGHAHELVIEKREQYKDVTLTDGTKLEDVQVWDPRYIRGTDDKTGDREKLRPLALYQPMKAAPREQNEFRSNELDRLYEQFATEAVLKAGLAVEPKYNGWRCSIQKAADGRLLLMSEDVFTRKTELVNYLKNWPAVRKEVDKLPGPFILDGEFMAVNEAGDPLPRRELAEFRGKGEVDDSGVRIQLFDILYHPERGNVVDLPWNERRALLSTFLRGKKLKHLELAPAKTVHSRGELAAAFRWARRIPGSEGMMLKSVEHTITLKENDLLAKVKSIREIRGIIYDRHPVKGSPGVYNFFYAVGPVSKEDSATWAEPVEVKGKIYVAAGKTFNARLAANVGDVLRIEVTEILLDESNPEKKRLRGFTPTVIDKTKESPSSIKEVRAELAPGELKKTAEEVGENLASRVFDDGARLAILKQSEEERYVKGVVLVPDETDSQGDIYDAPTVRHACHWFMEHARQLGLMHETALPDSKVCILENYVADHDGEVEGQFVRKGTWVLAARIYDDDLWQAVKEGRLTGWSIEGSALAFNLT